MSKFKKPLITAVQIAIAAALLWWVFKEKVDPEQFKEAVKTADWGWVGAGFAAFGILIVTGILRWMILLRAKHHRPAAPDRRAVAHRLFLQPIHPRIDRRRPGQALLRGAGKLRRPEGSAFLSVVVDRILGLLGLILVTVVIVWWRYDWLTQAEQTKDIVSYLIAALAIAILGIIGAFIFAKLHLVRFLPKWTPLREKFIELSQAFVIYGHAWRHSLGALALAMVGHIGIFYAFWLGSKAFTSAIPIGDLFAVLPIINALTSIPLSPGGLGIREMLFVQLLGVPNGTATLVSFTSWGIMLLWGVVGGCFYPFYKSKPHGRHED
ncbi:MAG: lysylphosphatidylglycerol synthase transmembrane domain-containing protein [Verrucomicrobiales bacterium]